MKCIINFTLIFFFLISCKNNQENSFFIRPESNKKDIKITNLMIETIQLQKIETSFNGILKIHNDLLYYADVRFCWVYIFDKDGNLLSKNLGQGGGPKELKTGRIEIFEPLEDGNFIFIGSGNDCYVYNSSWERMRLILLIRVQKCSIKAN